MRVYPRESWCGTTVMVEITDHSEGFVEEGKIRDTVFSEPSVEQREVTIAWSTAPFKQPPRGECVFCAAQRHEIDGLRFVCDQ